MPRPTTKSDLLRAATMQFEKLWKMIDSMSDEERAVGFSFPDAFLSKHKEAHWKRDKNIRDVLTHLHEWNLLFTQWVTANEAGTSRPFLPEPYTWKNYGELNVEFFKRHQATSYEAAEKLLRESHAQVLSLLEKESDESLFGKGYYPWTGGTTLGSYAVSVSPSHYDWAMRKLKAHVKTLKE